MERKALNDSQDNRAWNRGQKVNWKNLRSAPQRGGWRL